MSTSFFTSLANIDGANWGAQTVDPGFPSVEVQEGGGVPDAGEAQVDQNQGVDAIHAQPLHQVPSGRKKASKKGSKRRRTAGSSSSVPNQAAFCFDGQRVDYRDMLTNRDLEFDADLEDLVMPEDVASDWEVCSLAVSSLRRQALETLGATKLIDQLLVSFDALKLEKNGASSALEAAQKRIEELESNLET